MYRIYITLIFIGLCAISSFGQISEVITNERSKFERTTRTFDFKVQMDGKYVVKIVDPRGEIVTYSLKNEELNADKLHRFSLDTKNWRKGRYTIVAKNNRGYMTTFTFYKS